MFVLVFESDEICHEVFLLKNKFIWKLSHHSSFFNNTSDIHHTPKYYSTEENYSNVWVNSDLKVFNIIKITQHALQSFNDSESFC